ncbi:hypothetical protein RRF57_002448 [Xylaria bambusicola]|uniref:Ubiquitin-like protease family profile domain-containing protein n=1 Tax=Xylaria bambusicola TaxID=326684 RepID=A0AAN7UEM3_9PEZI
MSHILHYRSGQNVCSPSCPIEHIDIPLDKIKEPPNSWPDSRGLNSLNYSRDKWLNGDAIETSIAEYCRGLPQALQDKIGLGTPGLKPAFWVKGPKGAEAVDMAIAVPPRRALANLKKTEYSIFPVCSNDNHWVLVFMHKASHPGTTEWSHVVDLAIIDPERKSTTMNMVSSRLRQWLIHAGKFTFSPSSTRIVWVPAQRDATSCGPRAYWNAKQLIDRLLELHEGVISPEDLWKDLSGWFNEDFVRAEMMGRCAWAVVRGADYNARISVECVNQVREYDGVKASPWRRADRVMRPVDIKNLKPEKRPHTYTVVPDNDIGHGFESPRETLNDITPLEGLPAQGPEDDVVMLDSAPTPAPQMIWTPPAPTPNQHKLVPDLNIGSKDVVIIDDSDDDELQEISKGPAFSKQPSPQPTGSVPLIVLDDSDNEPPVKSKSAGAYEIPRLLSPFQPVTPATKLTYGTTQATYGLQTPVSSQINPLSSNPNSEPANTPNTDPTPPFNLGTPMSGLPPKPDASSPNPAMIPKNLFPQQGSATSIPKLPVTFPSPQPRASPVPPPQMGGSPAAEPGPKRRALMELGLGTQRPKATPSPGLDAAQPTGLTPAADPRKLSLPVTPSSRKPSLPPTMDSPRKPSLTLTTGSRKHVRANDDDEAAYVIGPGSRKARAKENAKGYKAVSWIYPS